jgi:hypothetical protein
MLFVRAEIEARQVAKGVAHLLGRARIIAASRRRDEIGIAERELAGMQRDLASMLQQKTRLAALGLAVSKINHDLRNLLASAQLFSDRLVKLPDPQVQLRTRRFGRLCERSRRRGGRRGLELCIGEEASIPASPRRWASPFRLAHRPENTGVLPHGSIEMHVSTLRFHRSGLRRMTPPTMPSADFSAAITGLTTRSVRAPGHGGDLPR